MSSKFLDLMFPWTSTPATSVGHLNWMSDVLDSWFLASQELNLTSLEPNFIFLENVTAGLPPFLVVSVVDEGSTQLNIRNPTGGESPSTSIPQQTSPSAVSLLNIIFTRGTPIEGFIAGQMSGQSSLEKYRGHQKQRSQTPNQRAY